MLITALDAAVLNWRTMEQIMAIEQEAFGEYGLDQWTLVPLVRYGLVVVAALGDNVVGAAAYMANLRQPRQVYLVSLTVRAHYRGQGIAKQLMHRSLQMLRERGEQTVRLTVAEENLAAVGLYESLGFFVYSKLLEEYGEGENRLGMEVHLSVGA